MFRLFGLLLVGLVLASVIGIGEAHAQVIHCDRKDISRNNLSKEAFNYWFPNKLNFEETGWLSIEGQESLEREEKRRGISYSGNLKYQLLPNGTLLVFLSKRGMDNWRSFKAVKYECDANAIEIAGEEFGMVQEQQNALNIVITPSSEEKQDELREPIQQAQQSSTNDTNRPTITVTSAETTGLEGVIKGRVNSPLGLAALSMDGEPLQFDSNGNFSGITYVPEGGTRIDIEAVDVTGLSSKMSVRLDRAIAQAPAIFFERLNPLKRKSTLNKDALALVIGVSEYTETNAKAIYADSDARVFQDYAAEKLGVPRDRVRTLVNDGADEKDMLLATKRWLARASKRGKSDIYVFFAGHGLASDDGSKMYLLPYDGAPELLNETAISRERLFADISAANPRSVTVFLDTCYSGTTRGTDMLIASRPIAIRALEQSIPDNFTVMTAAAGDQTAKPLEEAKHGMFSYFLMKGMEGEADANNDNEITAGELHEYVQTNVIQQSSGSQTPELQGDADRVLVRFQ